MAQTKLICPECGSDMLLRSSRFGKFYGCSKWPACNCTHGAHSDGRPLGFPADEATRKLRMEAHRAFDAWWKGKGLSRTDAYRWMREEMNLREDEAHIAKFDAAICVRLIDKVRAWREV